MIIFKYIKAAKFFPDFAPSVKNWKHKLRGKDGNGKALAFSETDKKLIKTGLKLMAKNKFVL